MTGSASDPADWQPHIRTKARREAMAHRFRDAADALRVAVPHGEAVRIRDDVAFFQAVQAVRAKRAPGDARPEEELDHAVRQIISRAVAPEGVVDIFTAAGLAKPDISILSEEFLAEVRSLPQQNLAVELLRKLLQGELHTRRRENVRAQLRVLVKRILRKHGYPPDKQEQATHTVLEQTEVLSAAWAAA